MCRLVIKLQWEEGLDYILMKECPAPTFDPTSFMRSKFVLMSAHFGVNFAWLIKHSQT